MIALTEEPYDGPVATALVEELLADLNARYAVWAEAAGSEESQAQSDDAYIVEVTAAMVTRPSGAFVVAWLGGEPVGCGALRPAGLDGTADVKRMYTRPAARRRGVGRLVLARLEEIARELDYSRARLETGSEQPEAIAMYEQAGWHRITTFGPYADHPASVCFGKDLAPR